MQIRVLFFGVLKDLTGRANESLSLPEHASLHDVLAHYESQFPRLKSFGSSLAMSINEEYAGTESKLHSGDVVALLPPVSGGSGNTGLQARTQANCRIVRDKIDTAALLGKIKSPADGAVVVFEGIVRNNSRGRQTLFLDYEAYEEMALKQMNGLSEQALSKFDICQVAIVHRLGRLQIGETSVVVIVASAHRAPAFEASRWLIDTLKQTVPIWKKEHFEDGAVWADGEPFPADLSQGQSSRPEKLASK